MSDTPRTWAEVLGNLAWLMGPHGDEAATEWVRQAVRELWGADSLRDLHRQRRALALQKTITTWYRITDETNDLAFDSRHRDIVRTAFAKVWGGVALDGPPWRLTPHETDRPSYADWRSSVADLSDFG